MARHGSIPCKVPKPHGLGLAYRREAIRRKFSKIVVQVAEISLK